jgi:hypothetical protein
MAPRAVGLKMQRVGHLRHEVRGRAGLWQRAGRSLCLGRSPFIVLSRRDFGVCWKDRAGRSERGAADSVAVS